MATLKYAKFVDTTKCDGCRACMVACKNWNDLPVDPKAFDGAFNGYDSHEKLTANTWNIIKYTEKTNNTRNEGLDWFIAHNSCFHCGVAACEKACPEGAISHTEFGSVVIDEEKCVACGYCVVNCTFDVIRLGERTVNGKKKKVSTKCTLCTDRLDNGLHPACVTACHTGSLEFGDRAEMLAKAEARLDEIKDRYPNAQIYNPEGVGETTMFYLLADKPETYGLPVNPKVPTSLKVWKDYAQPVGKLLFGATTMAVVAGVVSNQLFNPRAKGETHEGGHDHE
ncbi:MAG: 4Fe-4S ferredoxin iron-sulfur-binding protein [Bacillales bacterium]|jgi:formate dehydrogenase iron-sulfur subunit|nr:4Fe-4S ferredoxin iron-sulfur-binding protein [Bacillales bacterium]